MLAVVRSRVMRSATIVGAFTIAVLCYPTTHVNGQTIGGQNKCCAGDSVNFCFTVPPPAPESCKEDGLCHGSCTGLLISTWSCPGLCPHNNRTVCSILSAEVDAPKYRCTGDFSMCDPGEQHCTWAATGTPGPADQPYCKTANGLSNPGGTNCP